MLSYSGEQFHNYYTCTYHYVYPIFRKEICRFFLFVAIGPEFYGIGKDNVNKTLAFIIVDSVMHSCFIVFCSQTIAVSTLGDVAYFAIKKEVREILSMLGKAWLLLLKPYYHCLYIESSYFQTSSLQKKHPNMP